MVIGDYLVSHIPKTYFPKLYLNNFLLMSPSKGEMLHSRTSNLGDLQNVDFIINQSKSHLILTHITLCIPKDRPKTTHMLATTIESQTLMSLLLLEFFFFMLAEIAWQLFSSKGHLINVLHIYIYISVSKRQNRKRSWEGCVDVNKMRGEERWVVFLKNETRMSWPSVKQSLRPHLHTFSLAITCNAPKPEPTIHS